MMKQTFMKLWLAVFMVAFVSACATIPAPKSLSEQIAYGYGTVAAVRQSAAGLLERGQITVSEAKVVQNQADVARQGLDQARIALTQGLTGDAQNSLTMATRVLTALESYLKAKEDK